MQVEQARAMPAYMFGHADFWAKQWVIFSRSPIA